jgi:hypothetical protein
MLGCLIIQRSKLSARPPDDLLGSPIPKDINRWIRISVFGNTHHLHLVLWISTRPFPRSGIERSIVLKENDYRKVDTFVRRKQCERSDIQNSYGLQLAVTEHRLGNPERACLLPADQRCEFVYRLSHLPSVLRSKKNVSQLRDFIENIECLAGRFQK